MPDGRHQRSVIQPLASVRDAPAEVLDRVRAAALAEGFPAAPDRIWCPHCAFIWDWPDLIVGQVPGTAVYLPLCPTADYPGIGWLHLRDAAQAPSSREAPVPKTPGLYTQRAGVGSGLRRIVETSVFSRARIKVSVVHPVDEL